MAITVQMKAPAGLGGAVQGSPSGTIYGIPTNGVVSVQQQDVHTFLNLGFEFYTVLTGSVFIEAPLPADLVSVSAAAVATNRTLTIAAQPPRARKLQVRQVISTAITAGILTVTSTDQDGNAIVEVFSLIASVSQTLTSKYAHGNVTSAVVSGLVGGGDGTLGIGVSNDFGIPGGSNSVGLVCTKATKVTKVLGTSVVAADDVSSTTTVDAVARTIAPTTAPSATGLIDYTFNYTFGIAD